MDLTKEVFDVESVTAGIVPTGDDVCRFSASKLESVFQKLIAERLGDSNTKLSDTDTTNARKPCPTFVVATSAAAVEGPPVFFRSYGGKDYNANQCAIWKAARATSAAPSFFKPMYVDIPKPGGHFLDGGML